jgi:hypothetical protein
MDTIDIKEKIKQMIDLEDDPAVLDAVKDLLNHPLIDPVLQAKLVSRALKAEDDIKAGRVYTRDEFKSKVNEHISRYK